MDRWKAEMGRVREKRRVEERRSEKRNSQKKEDAGTRKGRKVAKHGVFPMIYGSGGSTSRLAKAAGAEPSGQMRDEKLYAVVGRSTFRSQNVQGIPFLDHFWKLRCRKSARRCGAKHISKSKWDVEKVHAVVARSTFRSQNAQSTTCTRHFWRFRCRFAWQAQGIVHLLKSEGFVAFPKTMAGVEHLKRICKDAFSVAGAVQKTSSWELLGGPGGDFLRRVAFWSIRSWALLRWFCMTGAALRMTWHHFFVAGAVLSTGGLEKSQNALVRGCQLCTQLSIFEGRLAELLCFWCCQVQKLNKSRRIASFWMFV